MKLSFFLRNRMWPGIGKPGTVTLSAAIATIFLAATPSASHTEANKLTATITVIPAFSHDFPTSGTSYKIDVNSDGPPFLCSVYASNPVAGNANRTISGEGAQFCSGTGWQPQHIRVAIQWYLGLGFWSNRNRVSTNNTNNDYVQLTIGYPCTGTGTHTYRIVTDGYAQGGAYSQSVQSQNYLQVTCHS
jgi:hypothetical protein